MSSRAMAALARAIQHDQTGEAMMITLLGILAIAAFWVAAMVLLEAIKRR